MNVSWLDRNRNIVFIALSVVALGGGTIFYLRQPAQNPIEIVPAAATSTAEPAATAPPVPTATAPPVRVYITGAINNSDVYYLPAGSIIRDLIAAAGGLTPDADIVRVNQALELKDQQQIHVPRLGEENSPPPVQGGQSNPTRGGDGVKVNQAPVAGQVININTATLEDLDALPGIGPAIAQRIIDYRESIGSFTAIEQITQVSGIGDATFDKIKAVIVVE